MEHGTNKQGTPVEAGQRVTVARNTCAPRNADTEFILKLIGKPLTRFELMADSSIRIEFDPHGEIRIGPRFGLDITASVAKETV